MNLMVQSKRNKGEGGVLLPELQKTPVMNNMKNIDLSGECQYMTRSYVRTNKLLKFLGILLNVKYDLDYLFQIINIIIINNLIKETIINASSPVTLWIRLTMVFLFIFDLMI